MHSRQENWNLVENLIRHQLAMSNTGPLKEFFCCYTQINWFWSNIIMKNSHKMLRSNWTKTYVMFVDSVLTQAFFFVFLMSFFHAKCENNLIWFKLWMSHSEELVWLYIMALCAHAICIWSFQNNIRNKNCSVLLSLNFLSTPNYFFNVTVLYFVLFCFFTLIHF